MPKSRTHASQYRRSPTEYILIIVIAGLFILGLWAYRAGSKTDTAIQQQSTYEPGTPDEVDNLADQDIKTEEAAEAAVDEAETSNNSALNGAADSIGGVFDETSY